MHYMMQIQFLLTNFKFYYILLLKSTLNAPFHWDQNYLDFVDQKRSQSY